MVDREKVIKGLEHCANEADCRGCLYQEQMKGRSDGCDCVREALTLLKEHEAVEPKVSSTEQRCGNCNKVIEMDGWIACPWCGKPIAWNEWWNKNGGQVVKLDD